MNYRYRGKTKLDSNSVSLSPQEFADDYDNFEKQVFDLDRRLGSILCQGFDDSDGLESVFKVGAASV